MLKIIQAFKPDWKGPLSPAESVELQKQVIDKLTMAESGDFLLHFGNKTWI